MYIVLHPIIRKNAAGIKIHINFIDKSVIKPYNINKEGGLER